LPFPTALDFLISHISVFQWRAVHGSIRKIDLVFGPFDNFAWQGELPVLPKLNERVMETSQNPYLVLVLLMMVAVAFALGPLAAAWAWARFYSPKKPGRDKNAIYECGLESKGDAWISFRSEYYLYAIIFLVFDVETIFLLPFAVSFGGLSVGAFLAMVIFLLLLVEGLVWAWRKGVLTWK
jgi:NADH-quinone oxidoreductase subunit A